MGERLDREERMSNGIKAWSWSRFADYKQCPRKAKFKHVQRMKEPGSAAMERGSKIHGVLSGYINGVIKTLPKVLRYEFDGRKYDEKFPDMKFFAAEFKALRAAYKKKNHDGMTCEDDWAFTRSWGITRWDDWVGCWVRMKLDLAHVVGKTLVITDWKSGRSREEDKQAYLAQLELYAIAGLIKYPEIDTVLPRLVFVDAGVVFEGEPVERKQLEKLKKAWVKTTAPMFLVTIFAPRPNSKCRWCWFGQSKKAEGGPAVCEY